MKKLLGIVVLGLIWCSISIAKEIKVYQKDENSISLSRIGLLGSYDDRRDIARVHCAQYEKFVFDFKRENTGALDEKGKKTRRYHCSKTFLKKSPITGNDILWTNYDSSHKFAKQAEQKNQIEKIKQFKEICSSLGFETGTEKFADCTLKMMMSYKKNIQNKKATTTTKSQSKIDWGKVAEEFVPKSNDNSSTNFCSGFVKGFVTGYMRARNTGIAPPQPYCPYQSYKRLGDPKSDYEHGYSIGYDKGSKS